MARLLPRKRTIVGGVLAVGLIVGIWLSGKLPHLGSGLGLGSGGDALFLGADTGEVAVPSSDRRLPADSDRSADSSVTKGGHLQADPPLDDVLTILVDGRHYAVWRSSPNANGYFPAELDELVQLALEAKPNEEGLRVRILRSESARVTAWQKLQTELVQAGVPAEAIVLTKDLVK